MHGHLLRFLPGFLAIGLSALQVTTASLATAQESLPIGYWKFDEATGSSAIDSATKGHTGTIVGALRVTGKIGGALSFNGSGDYVFASDAQSGGTNGAGLDIGTRDWTVAAWINTTSSGMVVTKMGFVGGANPDGWGMSVSANGTVGAVIHRSGGGIVNIFSGD